MASKNPIEVHVCGQLCEGMFLIAVTWPSSPQTLFPTVYHTKKMIEQFCQEREVWPVPGVCVASAVCVPLLQVCVYVDLHGHSRKHNVFMYGCHTPQADHTHFLYERVLPFLLAQQVRAWANVCCHGFNEDVLQAPSKFSFASCKFAVQRGKEATGRVVTWRSGVPNSFTLEATFCGSNLGSCRYGTQTTQLNVV